MKKERGIYYVYIMYIRVGANTRVLRSNLSFKIIVTVIITKIIFIFWMILFGITYLLLIG